MNPGSGLTQILEAEREFARDDIYRVGSMLSYDERLLLHWSARTGPPGAVVDLGSFLGGSTLALALGAKRRDATVSSYDRFVMFAEDEKAWLKGDSELSPGDSIRDEFEHNISQVRDRVVVHQGELAEFGWTGGPIGVLFNDITKSWATSDFVSAEFFPALQPGSILIQQDFAHWGHPWCVVSTEEMADCFEYLGWTWYSSAVYRCIRTPPRNTGPLLERLSCDQMLHLIDRAADRIGGQAAQSIRLTKAWVLATDDRFGDARDVVAAIKLRPRDELLPHIDEAFAYLEQWITEVESGNRSALQVSPNIVD